MFSTLNTGGRGRGAGAAEDLYFKEGYGSVVRMGMDGGMVLIIITIPGIW